MNNIIISALDEQFKKDCKVINLKYEYPGYTGIEQWAIITDLSEEDLCTKYAEQVAPFRPYILLSASFGVVRDDYRRNEKKANQRTNVKGNYTTAARRAIAHFTNLSIISIIDSEQRR